MSRVTRLLFAVLLLLTLTGSRCTVGEAGTAPKQQADTEIIKFRVRSSSFRVHVRATIGRDVKRDDPTVVPWTSDPYPVKPSEHVELRATLMDIGDEMVFCAILDKDGHEITSEEVHTPRRLGALPTRPTHRKGEAMSPQPLIYRAYARVYPDGRVTRIPVHPDIPDSVTEPALTRLVDHSHPVPPNDRHPDGYYKVGFVGPDPGEVEAAVTAAVELAKQENV